MVQKIKKKTTKKANPDSKSATSKTKANPATKTESVEPAPKKAKKTKVPTENLADVMGTLQAAKVLW